MQQCAKKGKKNALSRTLKLLNLFFSKVLHEKLAKTDHPKEMLVLILKGLEHVNTVLKLYIGH